MYGLFARLGGMDAGPRSNPRRLLPLVRGLDRPGRGGSYEVVWPLDDVAERLGDAYRGYTTFSVIRDPFDRTVSNYHNKLNRFARRFAPSTYFGSYLGPVFRGGSPFQAHDRIRWMQRRISFDRFIDVIAEQGVAWDCHFDLQVRLLGGDAIRYDRLLPLESLASGLRALFAVHRPARSFIRLIEDVGCLNASGSRSSAALWTPRTRSIVAEMYASDLEQLGYAARRAA